MAQMDPPSRSYSGELTDPTRWAAFSPRDGDIVVCTPPKSGTTWTQGILAMLIAGDPGVDAQTSMKSPWIDIGIRPVEDVMERLEAQTHRRQVKTHTPLDGIPYWSHLRYIAVFRHPIDVHFSFRKHTANQSKMNFADKFYPDDLSEGFRIFLEGDHFDELSLTTILDTYKAARDRRDKENLLCLHYADMVADLQGAVEAIVRHTDLQQPPDMLQAIVEGARFETMKANAHRFTPSAGQEFWRSDSGFFESATSNKWEGKLTEGDLAAYDARMSQELSPEDRAWLEWGGAARP